MAGEELMIANRSVNYYETKPKGVPHPAIPENIAVNMQEMPYLKQIEDSRIYDPIKLI